MSTKKEKADRKPAAENESLPKRMRHVKQSSDGIAAVSFLRHSSRLPEDMVINIVRYLSHTGPLACSCKSGRDLVAKVGGVCCDSQQFHHPVNAELSVPNTNNEYDHPRDERKSLCYEIYRTDDNEDDDWMGLTAHQYNCRVAENSRVWSCCNSHFHSTGCISNDGIAEAQVEDAIRANEQAKEVAYFSDYDDDRETDDSRDWDDSIYGDAKRSCTCGYADGLCCYCVC